MPPVTYRLGGVERLISVDHYSRAARRPVPRLAWDFVEGGADDMVTVARDRDAFSRWALRARAMSGHRERPLGSTVARLRARTAGAARTRRGARASHWRGDVAAARAAEAAGTRLVLSTASSW